MDVIKLKISVKFSEKVDCMRFMQLSKDPSWVGNLKQMKYFLNMKHFWKQLLFLNQHGVSLDLRLLGSEQNNVLLATLARSFFFFFLFFSV